MIHPYICSQKIQHSWVNVCITMKAVIISRKEWAFILRCSVQSSSTTLVKEMNWCYSAVQFIHLLTGQFSTFQLNICLTFSLQYLFINSVKGKIIFHPYNKSWWKLQCNADLILSIGQKWAFCSFSILLQFWDVLFLYSIKGE